MVFNNFLIISQRDILLWCQAGRVTVLPWGQRNGWALQPNLYQWAPLFPIFAKSVIVLEMELSFFNPWHSSFWKKPESPGKGAHEEDNGGLATAHMLSPPGDSLWTHLHAATTRIGSSDRNRPKFTRKELGYRAGPPSVSVPPSFLSPEGLCVSLTSFISNTGGYYYCHLTSIFYVPASIMQTLCIHFSI